MRSASRRITIRFTNNSAEGFPDGSVLVAVGDGVYMIVLGIDTATPGLGVALAGPDGLLVELSANVGLRHAQGLLPAVERALADAELGVEHVEAVAVTIGPGSFTSVRIGLNTAKGLCMAREIPLIGISTLAAAAGRIPFADFPVVPWLDAKRREVYAGVYDTSTGFPKSIESDSVIAPAEWLDRHDGPAVFLGDGAQVYRDVIIERLGNAARFAPDWIPAASAGVVAVLGRQMALAGETIDVDAAAPVYLRRPDAKTSAERRRLTSDERRRMDA